MNSQSLAFIIILATCFSIICSQPISAKLKILTYDPMSFSLSFSQKIKRPSFQLMLNRDTIVPYVFLDEQIESKVFKFAEKSQSSLTDSDLEQYSIIFNYPLSIGPNRLEIKSYKLQAEKAIIIVQIPPAVSITIVVIAYLLIYFTTLGHIIIEFLQVYCLFMYHDYFKTTIYQEISAGMFLINPYVLEVTDVVGLQTYINLSFPSLFILVSGVFGFILKRKYSGLKSLQCKIGYEIGVFNIFINASIIFIFPIVFNSVSVFKILINSQLDDLNFKIFAIIVSYLNLVLAAGLLFLFWYSINPKIGQSKQSWLRYLESESFENYRKLYEGINLNTWKTRNSTLINFAKRLLIVFIYFWNQGSEYLIFFLQFFSIAYVFIVSPYKNKIYANSAVIIRLLIFSFYGIAITGDLYFSLGTFTFNSIVIKTYLMARLGVFMAMIAFIFFFIFYEMYHKCSELNYKVKIVKEQNQYRLQIIQKDKSVSLGSNKRKNTIEIQMQGGVSFTQKVQRDRIASTKKADEEKINMSFMQNAIRNKRALKLKKSTVGSISKNQIQFEEESMRDRKKSLSIAATTDKKKWRKESLLNEILKN